MTLKGLAGLLLRLYAFAIIWGGIESMIRLQGDALRDQVQTTIQKSEAALKGASASELKKIDDAAAERSELSRITRMMAGASVVSIALGVLVFALAPVFGRILCAGLDEGT